jgi:PTS system nitrogen regulatory IIA component
MEVLSCFEKTGSACPAALININDSIQRKFRNACWSIQACYYFSFERGFMYDDILLSTLVERGGVLYEIPGTTMETVLAEFIKLIPDSALSAQGGRDFREDLLKAALEREALMSTGTGCGIALPHPRNPMAADAETQFVTIGFPALPVDWKALDGKPVHSIIFVVSASPKDHLRTLSKINFLCMDDKFPVLLQGRAPSVEIIRAIREAEQSWKQ